MTGQAGADRRRYERRSVHLPGRLTTGDQTGDCVVFDISAGGAVVQCTAQASPSQSVRLKLTEKGEFSGTIVWQRAGRIGIKFDHLDENRLDF